MKFNDILFETLKLWHKTYYMIAFGYLPEVHSDALRTVFDGSGCEQLSAVGGECCSELAQSREMQNRQAQASD